ncbi:hypothetical protein CB373_09085 [Salmonella enterica subsp. enterica serovar Westminster]|nr:hypothetical protein [Salmonella enterica]EBU7938990.1 hypothetical protein [Salmonella enterica subsp. enterica serovar Chittagong]ECI2731037.1 hypothetical protein [Salmonella enterica subsp. enterica]EDH3992499.1 hypothetical protein [Salmonella enterica subsp. enterica serovar Westminster]EDN7242273.1 hypothetical protein [Salmonella enterica subsp. enterica serovar Thompson]EEJ7566830.1 hypothetical protein [Salmonella enterica subsp. salamae]EGZ4336290.1 hypothetical protein [Salmone
MNFGWIMMCRGESARGDKRHFSVSDSVGYALLFFERDTKTIIPGKKMPGLHQAFQQTRAIAKIQITL